MPLNYPSQLYTGGKAVLNPNPYTQIALQAQAKKQAKQEALNQYYEKLPSTINDKGVRDQEIPVINKMRDELYKYGVDNRKALINPKLDNGAARYNLDKRIREVGNLIRESQNAAKTDLELGKLYFNKENQWALSNDDFINQHSAHSLPVNDPNYKRLDLASVMSQRPFDENTFAKNIKGRVKYGEKVDRIPDPNNPGYEIVRTTPVLSDDDKQGLYNYAVDMLHNDPSFARKIKKDLAGTGQLQELNKISQKTFGHEINSDEDIAAAYTMSKLFVPDAKEKSQPDWGYRFGQRNKEWDRRNKITYRQSMNKIAANKQGGLNDNMGYLSDEIDNEVGENIQLNPVVAKTIGVDPNQNYRVVYADKVDPVRLGIVIGSKNGIGGVKAIEVPQPNGTTRKAYLVNQGTGDWVGKDGQEISRERVRDDYIKSVAPSKFKAQMSTKGSENTNIKKNSNLKTIQGW